MVAFVSVRHPYAAVETRNKSMKNITFWKFVNCESWFEADTFLAACDSKSKQSPDCVAQLKGTRFELFGKIMKPQSTTDQLAYCFMHHPVSFRIKRKKSSDNSLFFRDNASRFVNLKKASKHFVNLKNASKTCFLFCKFDKRFKNVRF